jgi:hypothetical protein
VTRESRAKIGRRRRCYAQLDKAEFCTVSLREGLRNQICDLLELLGRDLEAKHFRKAFQAYPPFQRMFWETYDALEAAGAQINHYAGAGLIAINIRQFQKQCAKFGYPTYPDAMYRKYLPFSEGRQYLGEEYIDSRIARNSVSCLLFKP